MPTLKINISGIGTPDSNKNRSATFTKVEPGGGPSWATVVNNTIILTGPGAASIDLEWQLPADTVVPRLQFLDAEAFTVERTNPPVTATNPDHHKFTNPQGSNPRPGHPGFATLTVSDANDNATNSTFEYTLHMTDSTMIDPSIINR